MMIKKRKALLVGVNINNDTNFNESMDELKNLAIACEFEVIEQVVQNLKTFNKVFCVGPGKVEEINLLIEETNCDVVIFDNELSPTQLRNLGSY